MPYLGHLCRHLRGVPGDPSELGPLSAPVPHRAAHPRHGRVVGAGSSRWLFNVRAAGLAQGVVPTVHDDVK
jgi:hypothetical protein